MGKEWHKTEPQRAYLESCIPAYIAARAAGRQELFKQTFVGGWLDQWSEQVALFGEAAPDSPPLTKEQLELLGEAVKKRREVSTLLQPFQTNCSNTLYPLATLNVD